VLVGLPYFIGEVQVQQLLGYGEDALTYRALTERFPEVLDQLGDESTPEAALVFFRPSFGRRSGVAGRTRGSAFGEFDAIIATDAAVYLVEAKWSRSGETFRQKEVLLRAEQSRRHHVLRWYLQQWREQQPATWDDFRSAVLSDFEAQFDALTIPTSDRHLAANLEYVLRRVANRGVRIVDVLLYGDVDKLPCPPLPEGNEFQCVSLVFTDADRTGFFPMRVVTAVPEAATV
jgi:hypothetical protein